MRRAGRRRGEPWRPSSCSRCHLRTGSPILYTSGDSVFQVAAHEELIPPEDLYTICRIGYTIALSPRELPAGVAFPDEPATDAIDKMILGKLKRLNIIPDGGVSRLRLFGRAQA